MLRVSRASLETVVADILREDEGEEASRPRGGTATLADRRSGRPTRPGAHQALVALLLAPAHGHAGPGRRSSRGKKRRGAGAEDGGGSSWGPSGHHASRSMSASLRWALSDLESTTTNADVGLVPLSATHYWSTVQSSAILGLLINPSM